MALERYRITYEKSGALCYISHLDIQKVWVRTLLRAKIQLGYTQGFHPAPKLAPAWPLALGWVGKGEMTDLWFDLPDGEVYETQTLISLINRSAPSGLTVHQAEHVPLHCAALTTFIQSADYIILFDALSLDLLLQKMQTLFAQEEILRSRRGKAYDLKILTESWQVTTQDTLPALQVRMAARDSAMGRPDEIVAALGLAENIVSITRLGYIY